MTAPAAPPAPGTTAPPVNSNARSKADLFDIAAWLNKIGSQIPDKRVLGSEEHSALLYKFAKRIKEIASTL